MRLEACIWVVHRYLDTGHVTCNTHYPAHCETLIVENCMPPPQPYDSLAIIYSTAKRQKKTKISFTPIKRAMHITGHTHHANFALPTLRGTTNHQDFFKTRAPQHDTRLTLQHRLLLPTVWGSPCAPLSRRTRVLSYRFSFALCVYRYICFPRLSLVNSCLHGLRSLSFTFLMLSLPLWSIRKV